MTGNELITLIVKTVVVTLTVLIIVGTVALCAKKQQSLQAASAPKGQSALAQYMQLMDESK